MKLPLDTWRGELILQSVVNAEPCTVRELPGTLSDAGSLRSQMKSSQTSMTMDSLQQPLHTTVIDCLVDGVPNRLAFLTAK